MTARENIPKDAAQQTLSAPMAVGYQDDLTDSAVQSFESDQALRTVAEKGSNNALEVVRINIHAQRLVDMLERA